ncbi:MAG: hypothetical protein CR967_05990 [Proteobacteria bacterium]|nr:MAG: hypothetical protein CR967_05990 [Pseudomonadota bacterium]
MIKYLILAVLIYLIYMFFFRVKRNPKNQSPKESQTMVECSSCNVFVSFDEALLKDGKYFCSKECLGKRI